MSHRLPIVLLLVLGISSPTWADDVHLKNGKVYEGVLAERQGDTVRIRLSFGTVGIPASQVERIVKAEAPLQILLQRERALLEHEDATAESWLDLARWSQARGFVSAARDAALRAAEIDPELAGLESILRPAGFRYDEELRQWIPLAEYMARRGFVRFQGDWISKEALEDRIRRDRAARRAAEEREAARSLRSATEQLVQAATLQALSQARQPQTVVVAPTSGFVSPGFVTPGFGVPAIVTPTRPDPPPDQDVRPPHERPRHRPRVRRDHHTASFADLAERQPGSFLPIRSSRSGFDHPDHRSHVSGSSSGD